MSTMTTTPHDQSLDPVTDRRALAEVFRLLNSLTAGLSDAIDAVAGAGFAANADVLVLMILHDGPARPRDLLEPSGLTSAGLSALLDRLERAGLAERTADAVEDRRGVVVTATSVGNDAAEAILATVETTYRALLPVRRLMIRLLGGTVAASEDPSAREITERLGRLGITIGATLRMDDFPDDPTPTKTALTLDAASSEHGTRPRELIDITRLTTGGVTLLLDRLERRSLIERLPGHHGDRRAVAVVLTAEGREALAARLDRLGTLADDIVAALR
jgi:DNA-binding MarR family transcriptional regulator